MRSITERRPRVDTDELSGALYAVGSGLVYESDGRRYVLLGDLTASELILDVATELVPGLEYHARLAICHRRSCREFATFAAPGALDLQRLVRRDLWTAAFKIKLAVIRSTEPTKRELLDALDDIEARLRTPATADETRQSTHEGTSPALCRVSHGARS